MKLQKWVYFYLIFMRRISQNGKICVGELSLENFWNNGLCLKSLEVWGGAGDYIAINFSLLIDGVEKKNTSVSLIYNKKQIYNIY